MRHSGLSQYLQTDDVGAIKGPLAIIMAEDGVEIDTTLRHHLDAGFRNVLLLAPPEVAVPADLEARIQRIDHAVLAEDAMMDAVNRISEAVKPGVWIYYCYNAEYLFFPFSETRRVAEMLAFHTEERRSAMLTYVVDLYAGNLDRFPNGVALEDAHIDRLGYYALGRDDAVKDNGPKERQLDFFGGLRWRFEEHVTHTKRKIDRISLFKAKPGLKLRPDFTFTDEEYNTYACPWHHNLTATVCSFRTAKALKTNPGSKFDIQTFRWHNSIEFQWHSQQLMDLGLMEPGQWF